MTHTIREMMAEYKCLLDCLQDLKDQWITEDHQCWESVVKDFRDHLNDTVDLDDDELEDDTMYAYRDCCREIKEDYYIYRRTALDFKTFYDLLEAGIMRRLMDLESKLKWYVNVYEVTRHYGGPEEGGWWYNHYECVEVFPVRNQENGDIIRENLYEEHRSKEHGNIYSVLGGMEIAVLVENNPAQSQTKGRPYYE